MTEIVTTLEHLGQANGTYTGFPNDHLCPRFNESHEPTTTLTTATELNEKIMDIRSNSSPIDLKAMSMEGLRQPYGSKFLPSLLLWDNKGQNLYNEILATKHYYPYRVENELINESAKHVARKIAAAGAEAVIELGAGNMHKTGLLLSALDDLEIPLTYYALDVDPIDLKSSLHTLEARAKLRNIRLRGLIGTYDDGASWLRVAPEARNTRVALIWLGTSIANYTQQEASNILGSFISHKTQQNVSGIYLTADGCRDESMIECAYDTPGGQSRRFIKHGLEAARQCLGPEATELLDDDNWRVEGRWNSGIHRYENTLCAAKPLACTIGDTSISVQRGERVRILSSGKWTKADLADFCGQLGLEISDYWKNPETEYGKPTAIPEQVYNADFCSTFCFIVYFRFVLAGTTVQEPTRGLPFVTWKCRMGNPRQ
jgi:EasF-like predicted methyltransferase